MEKFNYIENHKTFEYGGRDFLPDSVFERANEEIEQYAIKLEDFSDLYGEENISKDKKEVERLEAIFSQDSKEAQQTNKLATVFEAILCEHSELSEWLGPNVFTIKTSRYDDIKNGVDGVAEFHEDNSSASHLALAVDITFSSDTSKKFERIKNEINSGKLAKIKYFKSEQMKIRGELANVPRVVIGVEARTVKELADLWTSKDNRALGKHPVQFQILKEIIAELETFKNYANKIGKEKLVKIFNRDLNLVKKIYENKKIDDIELEGSFFEFLNLQLKETFK